MLVTSPIHGEAEREGGEVMEEHPTYDSVTWSMCSCSTWENYQENFSWWCPVHGIIYRWWSRNKLKEAHDDPDTD